MLLTDIGRGRARDDAVRFEGHPAHRHDRPHLVFVLVGRGVLTVDGRPLPLTDGEGVWLPSGTEHALDLDPGGVVMGPVLSPAGEPPGGRPRLVADPAVRRVMTTLLGVGPCGPEEVQVFRAALERTLRARAASCSRCACRPIRRRGRSRTRRCARA
ncbi:cupin domain-containing protein [Pseudonocardia saturnea]